MPKSNKSKGSNWVIISLIPLLGIAILASGFYLDWTSSYSRTSISDVECPYHFGEDDTMNSIIPIGNYGEMFMSLSFNFTSTNVKIDGYRDEGKNYSKYENWPLHPIKNGGEKINIYLNLSDIDEDLNTTNFTIDLWSDFTILGLPLFKQHVGDLPVFCSYTRNESGIFVYNGASHKYANDDFRKGIAIISSAVLSSVLVILLASFIIINSHRNSYLTITEKIKKRINSLKCVWLLLVSLVIFGMIFIINGMIFIIHVLWGLGLFLIVLAFVFSIWLTSVERDSDTSSKKSDNPKQKKA